ncbi:MAG TPA: acyloxyacyl hydrolase [Chthoniobacterales bacterium]|nr:acyloxyacyl hydrolase [Chthoniobacterales bacterium]
MKFSRLAIVLTVLLAVAPWVQASTDRISTHFSSDSVAANAPSFELSTETAYLVGIIGNPNSYEVAAQFFTARWRWGVIERDSWMQGYNQVYATFMVEPLLRGPENFYYGISLGFRYNFAKPGARFVPYVSGGVGLGWLDSHANIYGAQGQDFTFNILTATGVAYRINDHWKMDFGVQYQHFSNAAQTDPNPSVNLLGPQIGVTYSY